MKITIHHDGHVLKIDFGKKDAGWALLVIDDKADMVKRMVRGAIGSYTGTTVTGLNEACISFDAVNEYWNTFRPSTEKFEKALLLLTWMVHDADDLGAIVFSPFPDDTRELESLRSIAAESDGFAREVACLIDIKDDSVNPARERFVETWLILDGLHHPQYARARFTRGGPDLPPWTEQTAIVRKEPPQGGYDALKVEVQDWLMRVRGLPSEDLFQRLTSGKAPDSCHAPSNLLTASPKARVEVCTRLVKGDCCGVWQWALEVAVRDPLPPDATHRWLCAKAFQTSVLTSDSVPLTAMIGICEGARFLVPELAAGYAVRSPLMTIPNDETVDSLLALGALRLAQGSYGEFARSLRSWIVQPEQFKPDKGRVEVIDIVSSIRTVSMEFRYSSSVEPIFSADRPGRAKRAWQQLAAFAKSTTHRDNYVTLNFELSN